MSGMYKHFGQMTWPQPGEALDDLVWRLLHGEPSKNDLAVCASVITAYSALIQSTAKKRGIVVRELKS